MNVHIRTNVMVQWKKYEGLWEIRVLIDALRTIQRSWKNKRNWEIGMKENRNYVLQLLFAEKWLFKMGCFVVLLQIVIWSLAFLSLIVSIFFFNVRDNLIVRNDRTSADTCQHAPNSCHYFNNAMKIHWTHYCTYKWFSKLLLSSV